MAVIEKCGKAMYQKKRFTFNDKQYCFKQALPVEERLKRLEKVEHKRDGWKRLHFVSRWAGGLAKVIGENRSGSVTLHHRELDFIRKVCRKNYQNN